MLCLDFSLLEGTQLLITNSNDVETHFIKIKSDADLTGCRGSPINQTVVLKCRADNYREIRWYKNGELLDLSSEDISYNQTSGELVIRREDACELLGIYQCFASNDIDTVHVSTRVLPLGKEAPSNIVTELLECFNRLAQPSREAGVGVIHYTDYRIYTQSQATPS